MGLSTAAVVLACKTLVLTLAAAVKPLFLEAVSVIEAVLWRRTPAWPKSVNFFSIQPGRSRFGSADSAVAEAGFFFDRLAFARQGRQVYNQKLVYRMMVIVNDPHPLWISQVLFTRSTVYVPHKAVGSPCMCLVEKLDKI